MRETSPSPALTSTALPAADPTFHADPEKRLFKPSVRRVLRERTLFGIVLVACLLVHAAIVMLFFLYKGATVDDEAMAEKEITPVEIVVEPVPEFTLPEPKKQPPPPPPPKAEDMRPAHDAPREANEEKVERSAPNKENTAPPAPQTVMQPKPAPDAGEKRVEAPEPEKQEAASPKLPDDKPDAEPLDKAEAPKEAAPQKKSEKAEAKKPRQALSASAADALAKLAPAPSFSFSSAAKPTPISGGNESSRYLAILYGMIVHQQHFPASARGKRVQGDVEIRFYLDETGRLTHSALSRSSGYPDLDAAAVEAVKRAAPFPPPPVGQPRAFIANLAFRD